MPMPGWGGDIVPIGAGGISTGDGVMRIQGPEDSAAVGEAAAARRASLTASPQAIRPAES
jgi:hypothetical protein